MEMKTYLIIIEKSSSGFSAYSPDVDGCVATGITREEAETNMREALEFHLEGLRRHGLPIPEPQAVSVSVEIPA